MSLMRCKVLPSSDDEGDPLITLAALRLQCSVVPYDEDSDGNYTHPDDDLLVALLAAAVDRAERFTGRSIRLKSYEGALDAFPDDGGEIEIAHPPLVEIHSVLYGNDSEMLDFADYALDDYSQPARIKPLGGLAWPTFSYPLAGVKIAFEAGYAAADLPAAIRQALLLMVADWYEHREDSSDKQNWPLNNGVMALLRPYRVELGFA